MSKLWTQEDREILIMLVNEGLLYKDIAEVLDRSPGAIGKQAKKVGLKSKNNKMSKTNKEYDAELLIKNPNTIRIEDYINAHTKILHKCLLCNTEYLCEPNSKLRGDGHCGVKNNTGKISSDKPGITYLVYIPKHNLYKIGVTSKTLKERMTDNNLSIKAYEVILERNFDTGDAAMKLEAEWLSNIEHLKVNTNLLKGGNTETFKYAST